MHHGLAAQRACGLVLATLSGVHHARDRWIMHRDIKPENLIFIHDWQLKVTDFGIAQVLTGTETMGTFEGAIVGTPAYMSPEQAEGRACGPQADVCASDALSMATARLTDDPVPITSVGPQIPGAIGEVAMHAFERSERERFPIAEEFGVTLAEASAETWGPEWMSEAGTAVRGSEAIEQASRTTSGYTINKSRAVDPGERETSIEATPETEARETSIPAVPDNDDRETSREVAPAVDNRKTAVEPAATPACVLTAQMAPVVPQQREHLAGANLHDLVPGDMLNLAQVRSPGSPLVPAVIAVVGLVLAVLLALTGLGSDPTVHTSTTVTVNGQSVSSDEIVEVDLTEPFAVGNIDADSVTATLLGIPIGSAVIEDGNLDPGYFRYSGAGVIELTPDVEGAQPFPVRSSNSVYPTAPFIVAAMVALGGMASVQSNLRGMRSLQRLDQWG